MSRDFHDEEWVVVSLSKWKEARKHYSGNPDEALSLLNVGQQAPIFIVGCGGACFHDVGGEYGLSIWMRQSHMSSQENMQAARKSWTLRDVFFSVNAQALDLDLWHLRIY
jgi:hypothetical protein